MNAEPFLSQLLAGQDLSRDDMMSLMRAIMTGEVGVAQMAGLLIALRCKGETVTEIAAAAEVMRELSIKVPVSDREHLVDTCGTGGDGVSTFNISTASALVAAAAGVKIAKHGGRSVSSTCGSADVLESLGVNVNLSPEDAARCVDEIGLAFMFAPNYHSAMKHAGPVRRELKVRTLFNVLGPLTNPAGAKRQLMGVYRRELVPVLAEALRILGSHNVMVVHGADGLDEISLTGESYVAELKDGRVIEYTLRPDDLEVALQASNDAIRVANLRQAKSMLEGVLDNHPGAARDITLVNAGAAIYIGGVADSLQAGIKRADETLASGAARQKLQALVAYSQARVA